MIAKHIPMNSVNKSDFAGLAHYISNSQDKYERVDSVTVTNCHASLLVASSDSDRLAHAIIEVTNTQMKNTRAESDKTYHLLVSFRAGERPDDKTLQAIESQLCEGLGFSDHQRISAVHTDTDNLHLHIAINKIHPTRYTIHDPYYGHKTLATLCKSLEQEFGLEIDNHRPFKFSSENKASDMEHHAGIESLLGWIKRECADQIKSASSWAELHQVLEGFGLVLRERGNGLVFVDQDGLMVKASSVARELSKVKLEDKWGAFNAAVSNNPGQYPNPAKRYETKPVKSRMDTTLLFNQFKQGQQHNVDFRAKAWKVARDRKDRLIAAIKQKGQLKRASIKLLVTSRIEKKLLYSLTRQAISTEIQNIKDQYNRDRQAIFTKHRPQQWADWLRSQAVEGNTEALAALRAREAAEGLKGNTVTAEGRRSLNTPGAIQDGITKRGTIIYNVGSSAIRDDGDQLKLSRGTSRDGLVAALRLAMERYGKNITVNGSAAFKAQMVKVAADIHLALTFTDPTLERQRCSLIATSSATPTPASQAADQYIQEREQKRLKQFDIVIHRRYNESDAGISAFAGVRRIDGQALALLKRDPEILVMPVDNKTAYRLSRISIGSPVTCAGSGLIRIKGRSR